MKYLIYTISIFISSLTNCQTKEATIKWLDSKLPTSRYKYINDSRQLESYSYYLETNGNFEKHIFLQDGTQETVAGNFKNLNPNSIEFEVKGYIFIYITCSNSSCINQRFANFSGTTKNITFGPISNDEPDLPNRIVKALKHLIILYGGKKEIF